MLYNQIGKRFKINMKIFNRIWKCIDITLLVLLGSYAIVLTNGSIDDYKSQKTSLAHEEKLITNQPSFVLCFGLSHRMSTHHHFYRILDLGYHFNISYSIDSER